MDSAHRLVAGTRHALHRSRWGIATIGLTYLVWVVLGMAMAGAGLPAALDRRDALVTAARTGQVLEAARRGERIQAALLDFGGNLLLGGVTISAVGVSVVGVYPLVAYRGWVGGIVSVDDAHRSRLSEPREAVYYVATLILQLVPSTLAGGAGVTVGWRAWRPTGEPTWLGLPRRGLADLALVNVLVIPLFLVASFWEFLAR
jgi:hypothetical protein